MASEVQDAASRESNEAALPAISLIMPAYNCVRFIAQSLPPLVACKQRGDIAEILVVDDGSTDDTAVTARALGARVISSGDRSGQAAARNLGAHEARGDILWFVDADVVVTSDAPRRIREALAEGAWVAMFGSYDDAPPARNFFSQYKNLVHHHYHQIGCRNASTFWTGCGAVRRDAFLAQGGFDPRWPAIEDVELGCRLRAAGGRIKLVPELQCTHLKVWRFWPLLKTEILYRAIPWATLILARGEAGADLNVTATERVRALIACGLFAAIPLALVDARTWWLPAALLGMAFAANLELFALFRRRNGWAFAVSGVLYHQFYYVYSTAAYVWCWVRHKLDPTWARGRYVALR